MMRETTKRHHLECVGCARNIESGMHNNYYTNQSVQHTLTNIYIYTHTHLTGLTYPNDLSFTDGKLKWTTTIPTGIKLFGRIKSIQPTFFMSSERERYRVRFLQCFTTVTVYTFYDSVHKNRQRTSVMGLDSLSRCWDSTTTNGNDLVS